MPVLIGNNNIARNVSGVWIGDGNNVARRVDRIWIGVDDAARQLYGTPSHYPIIYEVVNAPNEIVELHEWDTIAAIGDEVVFWTPYQDGMLPLYVTLNDAPLDATGSNMGGIRYEFHMPDRPATVTIIYNNPDYDGYEWFDVDGWNGYGDFDGSTYIWQFLRQTDAVGYRVRIRYAYGPVEAIYVSFLPEKIVAIDHGEIWIDNRLPSFHFWSDMYHQTDAWVLDQFQYRVD